MLRKTATASRLLMRTDAVKQADAGLSGPRTVSPRFFLKWKKRKNRTKTKNDKKQLPEKNSKKMVKKNIMETEKRQKKKKRKKIGSDTVPATPSAEPQVQGWVPKFTVGVPFQGVPFTILWEFGEGVDSARGVAAIVVCCRNSSRNSSCDAIARNGRRAIAFFLLFRVQ